MRKFFRVCGILSVVVIPWFPASASAAEGGRSSSFGLGAHIGTLGLGPDITVRLTDTVNLRLSAGFGGVTYSDTANELDYDVELDFRNVGLLFDWHPSGGEFRFTLGAVYNGNELEGTGTPQESKEIGDVRFTPEQIGTLTAALDFPEVAGYAGIGFGNALAPGSRFTVTLDLGVLFFSEADFDLGADGTLSGSSFFQGELAKEEKEIQDDFEQYFKVHPVVSLGLAFRF